jgi:hypothetical protein
MRRQRKGFAYDSAVLWQEEISKSGGVRNDLQNQALHWGNLRHWGRSEAIQRRDKGAHPRGALDLSLRRERRDDPEFFDMDVLEDRPSEKPPGSDPDEPDTTGSLLARQV